MKKFGRIFFIALIALGMIFLFYYLYSKKQEATCYIRNKNSIQNQYY